MATTPDLVLSDVMMPRLDGFGVIRELRAEPRTAELPIILLSARAGEEASIEGIEAGADDYLVKPFSSRELLARVEGALRLSAVRRETAVRLGQANEELERKVSERTGVGMSPEVIEKAFDPFFTTKPIGVGTGLGLSMIYGFARQSGGQVRIYSEVGQGTMVCVYLPRHLGEAQSDVQRPAAEPGKATAGETVLVIDDEPLVRMLVVDVLEELGYTAIEAGDGPSGMRVLRSDARIDLLVTDVGLPNGMNGRQVAEAARELRPGLKILFVTGYAENAVLNHGHLDHGMNVVTKPFNMDDLGRKIRSLINDR